MWGIATPVCALARNDTVFLPKISLFIITLQDIKVKPLKNPPQVFPGRCCKSHIHLRQKSGGSLLKVAAFLLRTVGANLNRLAEIQTEHPHEALGVDPVSGVAGQDPEGLDRSHGHEILNILKGVQVDLELFYSFSPPVLYKRLNFVYNENIIAVFW